MMRSSNARGFTLIETLVAITVLTVSIIGPFFAIQNALVASYAARDQLIASTIAQEAIEYVRAIRDSNYIYNAANPTAPRSWLQGLDGTSGSVDCVDPNPNDATLRQCTIDVTQALASSVSLCSSGGAGICDPLRRNTTSYLYSQQTSAGNNVTVFTRSITLSSVAARDMRVTSTVTWTSGHRSYSVTLSEVLSPWL